MVILRLIGNTQHVLRSTEQDLAFIRKKDLLIFVNAQL